MAEEETVIRIAASLLVAAARAARVPTAMLGWWVGGGGPVMNSPAKEWEWVMGVNFWGVGHGIRVFAPIMLEQDEESHIVSTSSATALLPTFPSPNSRRSSRPACRFRAKRMNARYQ